MIKRFTPFAILIVVTLATVEAQQRPQPQQNPAQPQTQQPRPPEASSQPPGREEYAGPAEEKISQDAADPAR